LPDNQLIPRTFALFAYLLLAIIFSANPAATAGATLATNVTVTNAASSTRRTFGISGAQSIDVTDTPATP